MNAWEWVTVVVFGTLVVSVIASALWSLGLDVYLYDRRERKAIRASCRACQGTPVTILTGDAARSRIYLGDFCWINNPIGLCDHHHEQRQRIDRLERDTRWTTGATDDRRPPRRHAERDLVVGLLRPLHPVLRRMRRQPRQRRQRPSALLPRPGLPCGANPACPTRRKG